MNIIAELYESISLEDLGFQDSEDYKNADTKINEFLAEYVPLEKSKNLS